MIGLRWNFEQPYDGKIVSGSLTLEEPSDLNGNIRAGSHVVLSRNTILDFNVSYDGLGQNGLDILGGRLTFSFFFQE